MTIDFKRAAINALQNDENSFTITDEQGNETEYVIVFSNNRYTIRTNTETELINVYEAPSKKHPLGTDGNGMDLLTRLMYGGRISLMIGFVVVVIEILIGVLLEALQDTLVVG